MKLVKDKYDRLWLKRYGTFTLIGINHTGILKNNNIKTGEVIFPQK